MDGARVHILIKTVPDDGSVKREIRLIKVLLPAPLYPTIQTRLPGLILKLI